MINSNFKSLGLKHIKWKQILVVVLGALLLLCAAFFNGFPIVYSDTSTYLDSGFQLETPFDRPITYGVFLRFASFNGLSLWLVILTQALILSSLLYLLLKMFSHITVNRNLFFIGLMAFLSILTSVSWTTSQLISDIFTPIMMISFILLAFGKWSKSLQVILFITFLISTGMHMSHITFNVVFFTSIIVLRKWNFFGLKDHVQFRPILICLVLSLLSIATMGSALSKSKHAFFMGALVEHDIAKAYLNEHCGEKQYEFCKYKDSLPDKGWQFLWNESSPFYKMGGFSETKKEFNEIIYGTLTSPKYISMHIKESLKATGDQLIKFKVGNGNGPFLNKTQLYQRISLYFPNEIESYKSSRQNTLQFNFVVVYNYILGLTMLLSFVVFLFAFFKSDSSTKAMMFIILLGIIYNAWVCGTFANAIDRLGTKVMWLIPLIAILGASNYLLEKRHTR